VPIPESSRDFYAKNESFIASLLTLARDPNKPSDVRKGAFEKLQNKFSLVLVDPAIALVGDPDVEIAVEAVSFLASTLVGHQLPKTFNDILWGESWMHCVALN